MKHPMKRNRRKLKVSEDTSWSREFLRGQHGPQPVGIMSTKGDA